MPLSYKRVEVSTIKQERNYEHYLLASLNTNPVGKYFFRIEGEKLILYLNSMDLNKFEKNISTNIKKEPYSSIVSAISSIKSYGIKGRKRIYVDYDKERKVKERLKKVERRGIHFYANDAPFSRENTSLPLAFQNRIICGDSEIILKRLPDNCIDLVFTSPPYNFGLQYSDTEDGVDWVKYFQKLFSIFDECVRVLKYGGRIIINAQPLFSDYIPIHHLLSHHFIKNKMIWVGEILWEKNNYNCKYTAWGSWKSPSKPYLKYTWEFLEIFSKGDLHKEGSKQNADITGDEFKQWVYAKWSIAPERKMKEYDHPAVFPEELARRALKLFSFRGDVIMDPFNGTGTTTKVAKENGRKYLGIDISSEYCRMAEKRLLHVDANSSNNSNH